MAQSEKNILVVGGTTGIGKAISELLLAQGHHVYVASRQASSRMEAQPRLTVADIDSTDQEADWSFLPDTLHGLAYCAGTINLKPFKRLEIADFNRDFAVNLTGAVLSIKAALPSLRKGAVSSIVLFSSVAAGRGLTFHASVSAAKGAVEGLTRALSAEFAPEVRINALALSLTDTPLAHELLNTDRKAEAGAQRHPLKRVGKAEDAAQIASFLLDEKSGWITGQVIGVDGGMSTVQNL